MEPGRPYGSGGLAPLALTRGSWPRGARVAAAEELAAVDQVTVMRRDTSALYRGRPTTGGRQPGRRASAPAGRQ
ncbi:hypothetical protein ACFWA9_30915, partial [Kitasatospora sp. NPDC059973]|uniref:hypothetical protein n=1 Tax=Kitasatospora sp. NPDC059973 TaxID=3347020 RepID=UPI00369CF515